MQRDWKATDRIIHILGEVWKLEFKSVEEDATLTECDGYADWSTKKLVIRNTTLEEKKLLDLENKEAELRRCVRHEIVHAFFFESGLRNNALIFDDAWCANEELVDWIANQHEKLHRAFAEADALEDKGV